MEQAPSLCAARYLQALKGRNSTSDTTLPYPNHMGQSLYLNYSHIVFSTKHRVPLIHAPHDQALYRYLAKVAKEHDCPALEVGGHVDHVHLLCRMSSRIAPMDLLKALKTHSSRWMKTQGEALEKFYWQDGYGAFSVNPAEVDRVREYIRSQHEHHRKRAFKEEFVLFLNKYKPDYDERYLWD